MGSSVALQADDHHRLTAYRADPDGQPRGGVVLIQEVFGVNAHVRDVCEDFAGEGYAVIAPALFDRIEAGAELDYNDVGLARGRELRTALGWEAPLRDVAAALVALTGSGPVGVIGYCWGGSVAWLAATRLEPACAVGYYGGQIAQFVGESTRCPVMLHFGERDALIPPEDVQRIRAAHPAVDVHLYPAGHGFNCNARADYHPESAHLARRRTLAFLDTHLVSAHRGSGGADGGR